MDILTEVYNALVADDYIKEQALDRIKFYEYPATGDVINPHIVIDLIEPPTPTLYADNEWMRVDSLLQIDVWTRDRRLTDQIADKIRDIMWKKFGFAQRPGPKEYDEGVYRDARRYRGTLYREDFDSI